MRRATLAMVIGLIGLGCAIAPAEAAGRRPKADAALQARIARIENGFAPISLAPGEAPVRLDLRQLMQISNVPGLSVAVIDHDRIVWAKGYGVTEAGGAVAVTPHTLFQAASISKAVTALATLRLVEQRRLSLDEDVNLKLKSWKVPENAFTRDQKVTLRRILTHTAGTTVHGFIGYSVGEPVPTLTQILDGAPPANSEPVRVDYVPGSKQRYSGGGVLIEQQLLGDVTGEPFPRLMRETVLDPLGLKDSTFEEPLPASRARAAASGHQRDGEVQPGRWYDYPEMAVGGFWTTPSDLARIVIEVERSSRGRSNRILSTGMAREMLRAQLDPRIQALDGPTQPMGLGWMLGDPAGESRFGHSGTNPGFVAEVIMADSGHGVVVMANNWSFAASCVARYLINDIAREYGWRFEYSPYSPWPYGDTVVLAAAKLRGPQAAIARYRELKALSGQRGPDGKLKVAWATSPPDYAANEFDLLSVAQTLADPAHLKDAIAIMRVEVEDYPTFWIGHHTLGDLYVKAGDPQLAVRSYEKAIALNPGDSDAVAAVKTLKAP